MFDDIIVEMNLPLPKDQGELSGWDWKEHSFQTKDLENYLGLFKIDKEGQLWEQKLEHEDKTEEELAEEKENHKGDKWFFQHPQKVVGNHWEEFDHTGYVRFYDGFYDQDYDSTPEFEDDYWVEWVAHIVKGKVQSIEIEKWEREDSTERRQRNKQWRAELKVRREYMQTLRYRLVGRPWNWAVNKFFRGVRGIGSVLNNSWKLEDKLKF